jgi:hypothetical protein
VGVNTGCGRQDGVARSFETGKAYSGGALTEHAVDILEEGVAEDPLDQWVVKRQGKNG